MRMPRSNPTSPCLVGLRLKIDRMASVKGVEMCPTHWNSEDRVTISESGRRAVSLGLVYSAEPKCVKRGRDGLLECERLRSELLLSELIISRDVGAPHWPVKLVAVATCRQCGRRSPTYGLSCNVAVLVSLLVKSAKPEGDRTGISWQLMASMQEAPWTGGIQQGLTGISEAVHVRF